MVRFGVCSLEELYAAQLKDIFGKEKRISIELYEELHRNQATAAENYQELVLNGFKFGRVFKRTYSNRFAEFDKAALAIVRQQFGEARSNHLEVHDLAVSDGRTSLDLFNGLTEIYGDRFSLLASDILPWVFVLSEQGSRLKVVTDDGGRILELIYPPFVFDIAHKESAFYWINHLVCKWLSGEAARFPALCARTPSAVARKKIFLIHRKCQELAEQRPNFSFEQHDILQSLERQFDVVRAMNILNRSYFSEQELRRILNSVRTSLRIGGLFISGSNQEQGSDVDGGVYIRKEKGFHPLFCSCAGSSVHELIVGI
jgi:chemotaxis methyl-accepting protein methylase